MEFERNQSNFKNGNELTPLQPVDLNSINSFDELLEAMSRTAFTGRQLGRAFQILHDCFTDPETYTVLTLSGALTVAKQGHIICDLINRGCIQAVVSTGALLTHGLIEGMGVKHYMNKGINDEDAYRKGYNRIYDTIELETSFQSLEDLISENFNQLIPAVNGDHPPEGSMQFCNRLGKLMIQKYPREINILASAFTKDVPVYIPAFTDAELSLDLGIIHLKKQNISMKNPFDNINLLPFNPFSDLMDFAKRIHLHTGKLAIFTLGGGVPRNWAQQVAPLIDILVQRGYEIPRRIYSRGVRICPEPVHWGGLSGCTYREGVSWGKFLPESKGGQYAEIHSEISGVFPLLIKAIFQKMDRKK